jgi:probable HAF family extracellular repeat protein
MKRLRLKLLASVMFLIVASRWLVSQDEREHANKAHYTVRNLGSLGGTGCCNVVGNNDIGWVDGTSNVAGDQSVHPFLWREGHMQDLGTLGGPNANAGGMNDKGDVTVGGSDTTTIDPLGENWCGFGTGLTCRSYVWHNGKRTLVPTLGGNNGDVSGINDAGLVLGFAETAVPDATCIAPQVLGTKAFEWDPDDNTIRVLPPLPGDTVTAALAMNQRGDAVGASGICGFGLALTSALHAVVWRNGLPTDLGSFGGSYGNLANSINSHGQVVGQSDLAGDAVTHGFLWTEDRGIQDLGTLTGDVSSIAGAINDHGQIAMQSCDTNFNCRAAIWQDGVMTDLNTLIPAESTLFLLFASSINSHGQIVGAALDQSTGATVPFLATPCYGDNADNEECEHAAQRAASTSDQPKVILPEQIRKQLQQRLGYGRFRMGNAQSPTLVFLHEH